MLNPDKSLDRIKSLMHVIESGNKALIQRMEKPEKTFQSPKDRHYLSPDSIRNSSLNPPNKYKSATSANFFNNYHKLRPETTKNSNHEIKVLTTWTEAPKTTNTGAETTDRRISHEGSGRALPSFTTPNKEIMNLKQENSILKRKLEDMALVTRRLTADNERMTLENQGLMVRLVEWERKERDREAVVEGLKGRLQEVEGKHGERKKHMKQLIEIISEKEKQLEKAKTLINRKLLDDEKPMAIERLEIDHQKIVEYALFLENQLEIAENHISELIKENETVKNSLENVKKTEKPNQEKEVGVLIGNINQELGIIFESLKGIENQRLESENQYNNEFQSLEENKKKEIKRSIEDLEEQKQKLFKYLRGFFFVFLLIFY